MSSHHIRHAILAQLEAADPGSLAPRTLRQGLHLDGLDITQRELRTHLTYLLERGLVREVPSPLQSGNNRFTLSATGRDLLDEK